MKTCNCVEQMNTQLAEHNTRICETMGFPRDGSPIFTLPKIDTEKIETRKRVGPALAIPTFCPFCGTPYGKEPTKPTTPEGWQDISTAPTDGSYCLIAKFDRVALKWAKHSRWITAEECADEWGGFAEDYVAGWVNGNDDSESCYPTHWMPLPAPVLAEAGQ